VGSTPDSYLRGLGFESRPRQIFRGYFQCIKENYDKIACFYIFLKLLFVYHPTIRRYAVWASEDVVYKPQKNYEALIRQRTIPTERQPLVGEVSANFLTRVEAGSNTSTVNLRVVRGDEMGLKKAAP
jgi:hypothetical protein